MSNLNLIPFNDINFLFVSAFTYNNNTTNAVIVDGYFSANTLSLIRFDRSLINITGFTGSVTSISGLTSSAIINALGYTPYNSTNPSNYISSITSSQIINALGYVPLSSSTGVSGNYLNLTGNTYATRITNDIYVNDNSVIYSGDPNATGHTEMIFQNGLNDNIFAILVDKGIYNASYMSIVDLTSSTITLSVNNISSNTITSGITINKSLEISSNLGFLLYGQDAKYDQDYSSIYTNRSLTDQQFVLNSVSAITSNIIINALGYVPLSSSTGSISGNQNINFTGDVTGSGTTSVTLTLKSIIVPNTVGNSSQIPVIQYNNKGLIVSAYTVTISGGTNNSVFSGITLTTNSNSGAASLTGNTLNIPNYTLSGLGGVLTSDTTYVKTVILNTPNVIFSNPITFITSSNTATCNLTLNTQLPNTFLAGSSVSGVTTTPIFRTLVQNDLPSINVTQGGTGVLSATTGGLLYGSGINLRNELPIGLPNTFLTPVSGIPSWQYSSYKYSLGTIFNNNGSFSSGNYTNTGAGFTINTSSITSTSGVIGNFANNSVYNYVTLSEENVLEGSYIIGTTPSSTSGGLGFGIKTTNSVGNDASITINYDCSTGANSGHLVLYVANTSTIIKTTATGIIPVLNDVITFKIIQSTNKITVEFTNVTQNKVLSDVYFINEQQTTFLTDFKVYISAPNVGKPAIWAFGGSYTITQFKFTVNTIKGAQYMGVGDSITKVAIGSTDDRWVTQVARALGINIPIMAGNGNTTVDILSAINEIIALAPQNIFLLIGTNDLGGGLTALETNYASIISQLTTAGITVYPIEILPRGNGNVAIFNTWLNSSYTTSVIRSYNAFDDGTGAMIASMNIGDGLHPNIYGKYILSNTVLRKIANGYRIGTDNIRFNATIGGDAIGTDIVIGDQSQYSTIIASGNLKTYIGAKDTTLTSTLNVVGNYAGSGQGGYFSVKNQNAAGFSGFQVLNSDNSRYYQAVVANGTTDIYAGGVTTGTLFNSCYGGNMYLEGFLSTHVRVGVSGILSDAIVINKDVRNLLLGGISTDPTNLQKGISIPNGSPAISDVTGGGFSIWGNSNAFNLRCNGNGNPYIFSPTATTIPTLTTAGIVTTTSTGLLFSVTSVKTNHLIGNTAAPTIVASAGAGTSPTVSLTNATDLSGLVNITTGTLPTGTNAAIATITFNIPYGTAPNMSLTPANALTAALSASATMVYVTSTITTFVINAGTTGLAATTSYAWFYTAVQ